MALPQTESLQQQSFSYILDSLYTSRKYERLWRTGGGRANCTSTHSVANYPHRIQGHLQWARNHLGRGHVHYTDHLSAKRTVVDGRFQTPSKRWAPELEAGRFRAGFFSTVGLLSEGKEGFLKSSLRPKPARLNGGTSLKRQEGFVAFAKTRESHSQPALSHDNLLGL